MLRQVNKWIMKCEIAVALSIAAVAALIIILQVFARYLFREPFSWPEELAVFLLIWLTFIGASILLKRGEHIKVGLVVDRLPKKARTLLDLVINVSILIALVIGVYEGSKLISSQNISRTVALHIPRGIYFLPVVISFASMILFVIADTIEKLRTFRSNGST
ncbi:MAG TPA: TRAP transporter small permease [Syntrophobacteria bacterium]|nr:TRAP transporter small permease [Syntrophobacteria bacterium]